ncbi:MAG TPA: hypothetical protein VJZ78_01285 [Anaerolineales bacterium]|nr:hypothetical protein [Anaerolineales bacterium]
MNDPLDNEKLEEQPNPAEVQKETSKARRVWRSILLWLTLIAVTFLAGVLMLNYTRLQPTTRELTQAFQTIAGLEEEVSTLSSQLTTANAKANSLQGVETHRDFLQVQLDISTARLALANGDVSAARSALAGTTQRLEDLVTEIQKVDAGLAESLPKRLSLIVSGLENNVPNASVDLGLLANDLQDLVNIIYGE